MVCGIDARVLENHDTRYQDRDLDPSPKLIPIFETRYPRQDTNKLEKYSYILFIFIKNENEIVSVLKNSIV